MNHGKFRDSYTGTAAILSTSLIIRRELQAAPRRGPTPEQVKVAKLRAKNNSETTPSKQEE